MPLQYLIPFHIAQMDGGEVIHLPQTVETVMGVLQWANSVCLECNHERRKYFFTKDVCFNSLWFFATFAWKYKLGFVNANELQAGLYKGLSNVIKAGDVDPSVIGRRFALPSTFTRELQSMIVHTPFCTVILNLHFYKKINQKTKKGWKNKNKEKEENK